MTASTFDAVEAAALRRARDAASATDGYVHAHPWTAARIAADAGPLISSA